MSVLPDESSNCDLHVPVESGIVKEQPSSNNNTTNNNTTFFA